jgi:hypothetical protein
VRQAPALLFAICASVAVATAIVGGFLVLGSPAQLRMQRLDSRRVQNLQTLSNMIANYRRTHDSVPDTLDKLEQPGVVVGSAAKDPQTGEPYEYRPKDSSSYVLCARFQSSSLVNPEGLSNAPEFWRHEPGRQCFTIEVRLPVQR